MHRYYWAWCLGPNDSKGRPTKLIQGPYECSGEGMIKLNYDINRIYPQGHWQVEELDTRDRAKAVAELRHKIAYATGNLETALRNFYSKPRIGSTEPSVGVER